MEIGILTAQRPRFQHSQCHLLDLMGVPESPSQFHLCKLNRKKNRIRHGFIFKVVYPPTYHFCFPSVVSFHLFYFLV